MELKTAYEVAVEKLESKEPIPRMTNPLGMYWDQPDRDEITLDPLYALMSKGSFEKLAEYSCSMPSGVYPGKMWKNKTRNEWWLMWYGICDEPDKCSVNYRKILIV